MAGPYAEDMPYWKTGASAPDTWIDRAQVAILQAGGRAISNAYGRDGSGRAAFMLTFELAGEQYRIVWPVLPLRARSEKTIKASERSARIQAATMLYHDTKARCLAARVLGARVAFFSFLLLPDGRTAGELAAPELAAHYPRMLAAPQ